jgi:hydroxymethylglutaryl-CoA lyase
MDNRIEIVDVGPRDGLQSQSELLTTDTKLQFISKLIDAGLRRIEVASFVNPKRVPQMTDVDELITRLPLGERGVRFIGLVLNEQGLSRALATRIDEINCVIVTTDTFCQRNQGKTAREMLESTKVMAKIAQREKRFFGVTIGASFGCPFEGEVSPLRVLELVKSLVDLGVNEIALADTIGAAGPSDVKHVVDTIRESMENVPLRLHFHNTRNTGVANIYAAVESGVRIFDASCGGVGGCPFAPKATGNVGTEDVLYMLERMGYETGVDIKEIISTSHWLEGPLKADVPAMMAKAGLFPS